ncbi:MAG: hypothetical protein Crog4KO_11040 [Crocinitomicaceae bacterium]
MKDQATYDRNYSLAVSLALFLCLVVPRLAGPALLLLAIWVLIGGVKKFLTTKWNLGLITFVLLFSAYAIGGIYSNHADMALEGMEQKLSLLVVPFLFSFPLKSKEFRFSWLVLSLVGSVCLLSIYGLVNGFLLYLDGAGFSGFLTVGISPVHHPTYFMCFWILAMVGSYVGWKRKWTFFHLKWIIPFVLIGFIFHVLSLSLAGILYSMIVVGFLVLYEIGKKWSWKVSLAIFAPVLLMAYLAVNYVPIVRGQWQNAKSYADKYAAAPEDFIRNTNPWTGSEERLILWIVSTEILSESPMGLGTKNYDEAIYKRLKFYGQDRMAAKHFNPHNQYLTTGIEIGVIGIGLLLIMLFYGIVLGLRRKHWLLLVASSSLAFHCLFESMLERQSGIVFFCLMLGVFYVYPLKRTPEIPVK